MRPVRLLCLLLAAVLLLAAGPFATAPLAVDATAQGAVPSPSEVQFGDVTVGASAPAIVTIQNDQALPLTVTSVTCDGAADGVAVTSTPALPAVLQPGGYIDVGLTFTPKAAGDVASALVVECDAALGPLLFVPLSGTGVKADSASVAMVNELLAFYDAALGDGTLYGIGPGNSAGNRAIALRNMIEAAGDLVAQDDVEGAVQQLLNVANKCDGDLKPPDFVAGPAVGDFYARVNDVIDELANPQLGLSLETWFNLPDGTCVADGAGFTYVVDGNITYDLDMVYPEAYWGEYPVYLPGHDARISVLVTNVNQDAMTLTLVTEALKLQLDGTLGVLINQQYKTVTVPGSAQQWVDGSFTLPFEQKGLIVFRTSAYTDDSLALGEPPALVQEAIFCPPAYQF